MKRKRIKRRRLSDANNRSNHDSTVSINKKQSSVRVRLNGSRHVKHTCYVCEHEIGGREVYVGSSKWRCFDCYPGSPSYKNSEYGRNSKFRRYFLTKEERAKEGIILGQDNRIPEWAVRHTRPAVARTERKRLVQPETPRRVRFNIEPEKKKVRVRLNKPTKRVRLR